MASDFGRISAATTKSENRRRSPRLSASVGTASVRRISEQPTEAVLGDLSIYGCRIKSPLDHRAGERVWLRFAGANPVHATVVWWENGFAGCRFDVPIANALFRSLTLNAGEQTEAGYRIGIQSC
ncbi:hypothetical protein BH09PSE3_BH09PSE3_00980 [soil metagenome]